MNLDTFLTVLTIVAGLATIVVVPLAVVGLVQGRRRKLALQVGAEEVSLDRPLAHEKLKLTWDNVELSDARYVVVRVSNVGSGDLTSAMFDRGRPVSVTLSGCKIVGPVSEVADWKIDADANRLTFGPDLLKSRTSRAINLLVDGCPKFDWNLPLADVAVELVEGLPPTTASMERERSPGGRFFRAISAASVVLFALLALLFVVVIGSAIFGAITGQGPQRTPVPEECQQYVSEF